MGFLPLLDLFEAAFWLARALMRLNESPEDAEIEDHGDVSNRVEVHRVALAIHCIWRY